MLIILALIPLNVDYFGINSLIRVLIFGCKYEFPFDSPGCTCAIVVGGAGAKASHDSRCCGGDAGSTYGSTRTLRAREQAGLALCIDTIIVVS
jgi:hypothetical protein